MFWIRVRSQTDTDKIRTRLGRITRIALNEMVHLYSWVSAAAGSSGQQSVSFSAADVSVLIFCVTFDVMLQDWHNTPHPLTYHLTLPPPSYNSDWDTFLCTSGSDKYFILFYFHCNNGKELKTFPVSIICIKKCSSVFTL